MQDSVVTDTLGFYLGDGRIKVGIKFVFGEATTIAQREGIEKKIVEATWSLLLFAEHFCQCLSLSFV